MSHLLASDDFSGANGATLGSTPVGNLAWQAITGAWTYQSGRAHTSTGYASNPIVVLDAGVADADVSADVSPSGGDAVYLRCSGPNDWIRLRLREHTTSQDHYATRTRYSNSTYCCNQQGTAYYVYNHECMNCPTAAPTCPAGLNNCGGSPCYEDGTCSVYTGTTYYYNYYAVLESSSGGSITQLANVHLGSSASTTNLRLVGNGTSLTVYTTFAGNISRQGSFTSSVNQHVTTHGIGRGGPTDSQGSALDNFSLSIQAFAFVSSSGSMQPATMSVRSGGSWEQVSAARLRSGGTWTS